MSTRNRAFQPTTKDTGDLVIGLMKTSVAATEDVSNAGAVSGGGVKSLGALSSSSLSMTPSFKEHQAGYPQVLDFKMAELLQAKFAVSVEEIMDSVVLGIIDTALNSLETGAPAYYCIEALAEFATGGTLSMFSPYAQLMPSLSFSFGDDFASAPLEFEALSNPAYTNKDLIYRTRTNAGQRNTANQPMTKDVAHLAIGKFQVRVGKPSRRLAGTAVTKPAQKRANGVLWDDDINTNPAATSAGTYVGALDGAYIVEVTNATGPICSVTEPDGTTTTSVDFSGAVGTPVALGDGVTLGFSSVASTGYVIGDVWVVGVYTANAVTAALTGIASPYSFLTKSDSVGSISTASLETSPVYKNHESGYPLVKDLVMLESSTVTVTSDIEELDADTSTLVKGQAVNLFDILLDASINGTLYNVPVELVAELVTGGTISFWLPNCQITPTGELSPSNDWANMPFALDAQLQGSANDALRIYRQKLVQDV